MLKKKLAPSRCSHQVEFDICHDYSILGEKEGAECDGKNLSQIW